MACKSRTSEFRTQRHEGRTIKVYACPKHGECTHETKLPGIFCGGSSRQWSKPCKAKEQAPSTDNRARIVPDLELTPPALSHVSKLAIVTSFYNPHGSRNRVRIYPRFASAIAQQGATLFCIEGLFGDARSEIDSTWQVRVDPSDVMWHKESLLNVAIARLPDQYDAVMWIDADLIYDGSEITDKTLEQLGTNAVAQPWSTITYLDAADQPIPYNIKQYSMGWYNRDRDQLTADCRRNFPGGVWAARRETLVQCGGIYDEAITGGGDVVWAAATVNDAAAMEISDWPDKYRAHMLSWARRLTTLTGGRVGAVDVNIKHLYHGDRKDRQYQSRHEALRRFDFDPSAHLDRDDSGLLRWSEAAPPGLRQSLREYIYSRREDE